MRTIKFRAWDSENKKMFFYPKWATLHNKAVLYFSEDNDSYVDESDNDISVELMQFTGLLDKNGKEIYEGDIVREEFNGMDYEVTYLEGSYRAEARGYRFILNTLLRPLEVIGNIYESPELLK